MDSEIVANQSKDNTTRLKLFGLILVIVGTFSFSNHEKLGEVITLIGAIVILGSCVWNRTKTKNIAIEP